MISGCNFGQDQVSIDDDIIPRVDGSPIQVFIIQAHNKSPIKLMDIMIFAGIRKLNSLLNMGSPSTSFH